MGVIGCTDGRTEGGGKRGEKGRKEKELRNRTKRERRTRRTRSEKVELLEERPKPGIPHTKEDPTTTGPGRVVDRPRDGGGISSYTKLDQGRTKAESGGDRNAKAVGVMEGGEGEREEGGGGDEDELSCLAVAVDDGVHYPAPRPAFADVSVELETQGDQMNGVVAAEGWRTWTVETAEHAQDGEAGEGRGVLAEQDLDAVGQDREDADDPEERQSHRQPNATMIEMVRRTSSSMRVLGWGKSGYGPGRLGCEFGVVEGSEAALCWANPPPLRTATPDDDGCGRRKGRGSCFGIFRVPRGDPHVCVCLAKFPTDEAASIHEPYLSSTIRTFWYLQANLRTFGSLSGFARE
ncbi:hypothetical protein DFP72DRAFT_855428 [Ephemerocybe angulata]|uniref:Uncharacterized protein n=1 Tax=Ephemerocybe angulata TaxID=980116 RepID=A0A8H6LZM1_9AGAR|nr:hypothetical protein DFP72DRAFT_855428 [Tulosesus angulatus]